MRRALAARAVAARMLAVAVASGSSLPGPLGAQSRFVVRAPGQPWRTVETAHWAVHYPARAEPFARCLVPRLEPIYRAVTAVVGFAPAPRVTLVIEDAMSFDGAYASANARAPVIVLQTQPSTPRSGGWSDCATARMVHELTHVAQLARPWSAAHPWWVRAAMRALPAEPGPVVLRRSAWLREGYAEHVEGELTAVGAPYTVARADALRQLGAGDDLPRYETLSDSYAGQYLVGAAFVDWLAARGGDDAFRRLWATMASSDWPGEGAAFRTLFGAPPDSLYASFAAEVRAKAWGARARLTRAGLVGGSVVRRIGGADNVAVSPDGAHVAAVVGTPVLRVHVWPARDTMARPLRLPIPTGQSPNAPRFTRDGRRLLIVSWELTGGDRWRPDVYEWTLATQRLRRVTRGAAVREVDPMPNGVEAVGTRCEVGVCDLVRVDLATGALRPLAAGAPDRAYSHPRVSPDGRLVAAAVQSGASSRIALVDVASGVSRLVGPDDGVWRYEPAFLRDGRLVVVSEASGVANLELLDAVTHDVRALTRLDTPAGAPEPDPSGDAVYFVHAAAGGSELRRVSLDGAAGATITIRDSTLGPAAPVPLPTSPPPPFAPDPVPPSRPYGLGPRFASVLPGLAWNGDGASGSAILWSSDVVGRLSLMASATAGRGATWRGVDLAAAVRALPVPLVVHGVALASPAVRYRGASVRAEHTPGPWAARRRLGAGLALGTVASDSGRWQRRAATMVDYRITRTHVGDWYAAHSLAASAALGATGGARWARGAVAGTLDVGRTTGDLVVGASAAAGLVSGGAPAFERFAVGGARSPAASDPALAQYVPQEFFGLGRSRVRRVATARVVGPLVGPVAPFAWWGSRAGDGGGGQAVVGVSRELADDPRRNWRVPGARLGGGVGYAFGATTGVRAYLSLSFAQ